MKTLLPLEMAPKDGTLIILAIKADPDNHNILFDNEIGLTIGFNNFFNTEEDLWEFAGWNWQQDCFEQGCGTPIGWLPMNARDINLGSPTGYLFKPKSLFMEVDSVNAEELASGDYVALYEGPLPDNREPSLSELQNRWNGLVEDPDVELHVEDQWRGIFKVVEEMGEVLQVLGKLGAFPSGNHPDGGPDLKRRLCDEAADLSASLSYMFEEADLYEGFQDECQERFDAKLEKFNQWGLTGVGVLKDQKLEPKDTPEEILTVSMLGLVGGDWDCEQSPTGKCFYDSRNDPNSDQCIFCGDPDERK